MRKIDFQAVFETLPGNHLLLVPSRTSYTIAGVSRHYAAATHIVAEEVLEQPVFQVFPDNPDHAGADGVQNLTASLQYVCTQLQPHQMPAQRYDVRVKEKGSQFVEKHWSPANTPVMDKKGKLQYIIHTAEDITDAVKLHDVLTQLGADKNGVALLQPAVGIALLQGPFFTFNFVNQQLLYFFNKTEEQVLQKSALQVMKDSPLPPDFDWKLLQVYSGRKERVSFGLLLCLLVGKRHEKIAVDCLLEPIRQKNRKTDTILLTITAPGVLPKDASKLFAE